MEEFQLCSCNKLHKKEYFPDISFYSNGIHLKITAEGIKKNFF